MKQGLRASTSAKRLLYKDQMNVNKTQAEPSAFSLPRFEESHVKNIKQISTSGTKQKILFKVIMLGAIDLPQY